MMTFAVLMVWPIVSSDLEKKLLSIRSISSRVIRCVLAATGASLFWKQMFADYRYP